MSREDTGRVPRRRRALSTRTCMVGWRRFFCYLDDCYHWLTRSRPDGQHRICEWHDDHLLRAFDLDRLADAGWVSGMTTGPPENTEQKCRHVFDNTFVGHWDRYVCQLPVGHEDAHKEGDFAWTTPENTEWHGGPTGFAPKPEWWDATPENTDPRGYPWGRCKTCGFPATAHLPRTPRRRREQVVVPVLQDTGPTRSAPDLHIRLLRRAGVHHVGTGRWLASRTPIRMG